MNLKDVCLNITDGVHARPVYTQSGIPFISVKDITTGQLRFDDTKFISLEDHQQFTRRCKPEHLDILYTKVGATYGRPALVTTSNPFSIYVSVALIKPNRDLIDPIFLREVLATDALKRQADRSVKGAGVPDLHLVEIRAFKIPLPPLGVQREFVNRTQRINKLQAELDQSLINTDKLYYSLVQRAFNGAL